MTTVRVPFASPLKDAEANAELYRLPAATADALLPPMPLPLRIAEVGAGVALQVPWMVLSHEAGHARQTYAEGAVPTIHLDSWMSGYTTTAGAYPRDKRALLFGSGPNQATIASLRSFDAWARSGSIGPQEALGHLLARTNLSLYTGATLVNDRTETDPAIYSRLSGVDKETLFTAAVIADVASPAMWLSLAAPIRYIATGKRDTPFFAAPNFRVLLTESGPTFGGVAYVGKLSASVDVGIDGKRAAVTAGVHDVALTQRLRVGAGVGVGGGTRAEASVELALTRHAALGLTLRHSDFLLSGALGEKSGVSGHLAWEF